ncbi:MAG TPA: PepSY domain-containing protein [Terriglobales bacterium]|nr:PepSY domain-containing protein [Terriglobales bacterium]
MTPQSAARTSAPVGRWPLYSAIWRWHFYAGLFCIPFVIWLAITGSIYLFRPQIEAWLDKPYDQLSMRDAGLSGERRISAALAAVPGSTFLAYEIPLSQQSAQRVIVGKDAYQYRVYVHPGTAAILNVAREDQRPMRQLFYLHGELGLGNKGSMAVELAASWAIIMILSGLFLWWPRPALRLAGALFPRLNHGKRTFWRDLHAVTGLWVSFFALFLLLTGLPWAKSWGGYLKAVRKVTSRVAVTQDWTTGKSSEMADQLAVTKATAAAAEHADHMAAGSLNHSGTTSLAAIDTMIATVAPLHLAYPVLISPPRKANGPWTARSDSPNRMLRSELELDAASGRILSRVNFPQRNWMDRVVGIGVSAHEGQLFGLVNQLLGVFTALGLILICVSAVVLWWRRRPVGVLGAPPQSAQSGVSYWPVSPVAILAVYLPLLGLSMMGVFLIERLLLRRIPKASRWLGLQAAS